MRGPWAGIARPLRAGLSSHLRRAPPARGGRAGEGWVSSQHRRERTEAFNSSLS